MTAVGGACLANASLLVTDQLINGYASMLHPSAPVSAVAHQGGREGRSAAGAKQHHRNIYDHNWRRRGVVVSGVRRMNKVNARWARLVPGRVTVFEREYHLGV